MSTQHVFQQQMRTQCIFALSAVEFGTMKTYG